MTLRRFLLLAGLLLILFLGMYSWNQQTRLLDDLTTKLGLEATGAVLSPLDSLMGQGKELWYKYVDLVNVREENIHLKQQIEILKDRLLAHAEDLAELKRLRELVQLPEVTGWKLLGARVLAGRMGPNAVLDSITINRGYVTGGRPGTPLRTHQGLVGRILKASAHSAIALLLTDPGSHIAVITQESRAPGILVGRGMNRQLEVNFVRRDTKVTSGEILVTSGLDGKYPKGIPVARIVHAAPSDYTQFMAITAEPLVDLQHIEEVLLLEPTGLASYMMNQNDAPLDFVGPPPPRTITP
ncbi:MAG: rod shape-determining protein MreC [Desulfovibrio sp.]|nr:rod shape-determining protein MreC [Desulfovibrio sp.]